ncbi:MAG: hypothetical protein RR540_00080 [Oscillospiraceae bacterium]
MMKVEIGLNDTEYAKSTEFKMEDVRFSIIKGFKSRNIPCIAGEEQGELIFTNNPGKDDYGNMWAIIMALVKKDWFIENATKLMWIEDDDCEDILVQVLAERKRA